jgi:hypothetical protein
LRVEMRRVMHEHDVTPDEAMEALFRQRQAARKKRRTSAWAGSSTDSVKSGFRFLLLLVNLHFALILWFSQSSDRFTIFKGALTANLVLGVARLIGARAEIKATESAAPAVIRFSVSILLAAATLLGMAVLGVVWIGTPGSTYADVLRKLFHFN